MLVKQKISIALYLIMQRGTPEQLKIEYSVTAQKILVSFRMKYIGVCFARSGDGSPVLKRE